MVNRSVLALVAFLSTTGIPGSALSQQGMADIDDVRADLRAVEAEIEEAEKAAGQYESGALAVLAALNIETLNLTRSVLEARITAEEIGAPVEVVVPAVTPDPDLAASILSDIQKQAEIVAQAKSEADAAGGLMQALALTRYETERLSLAQLQQAWFRAQYGIAFPTTGAPVAPTPQASAEPVQDDDTTDVVEADRPAWADPEHPGIDYDIDVFRQLAEQGWEAAGWWMIERSKAEIDDSPQIMAVNVSDYGTGFVENPTLNVMCVEQQTRIIFNAGTFIMSDYSTNTLPVVVRVGEDEASRMRWTQLTSQKGAGLFGEQAEAFVRELRGEEKLFLRIEGNRGGRHDITVDLAGFGRVSQELASTCGFSLIELTREDFVAIQTLLNAGGYDAGTPDGIWGSGSRGAMSAYQEAEGLPVTGAPDEATLEKMGITVN